VSARRLWIVLCSLALALGIGACGQTSQPTSLLNNGVYVHAGPITYQLQVSRELNPFTTEDRQYLAGVPSGQGSIGANELWYGVFLWAKNQTHQPQPTSDRVDIVDSSGGRYFPIRLDTTANPYAWTSQTLAPAAIEPAPNTTASFGPTQGGLLLFKLPSSVYSNRPLTLQIFAPGVQQPGEISLDL
jgi:hypothetical protein